MLRAPMSRARAIALRAACSMTGPLVRRSRSRETAWITAFAASVPAVVTIAPPSGTLAAKAVIHAVSLDRDRRTSGAIIEAAVRSAMARGREIHATSIAFPALGTGVGGFPLDEAARITVETVREELGRSPGIEHVIFALRGAAPYAAFQAALGTGIATGGSVRVDP
jgi:O-acetyl-ADP-ribose deacetylase (regulator of RNase III)